MYMKHDSDSDDSDSEFDSDCLVNWKLQRETEINIIHVKHDSDESDSEFDSDWD